MKLVSTFNLTGIKIPLTKIEMSTINSSDIFEYILRRIDRTYNGIYDIVGKLDVLSLEKKRQLTIPLIKEIL